MTDARADQPAVPAPVIRLPRQALPGGVVAVVAIAAALLLFVVLDARRRDRQLPTGATATGPAFSAPPPLALPPEVPPPAPVQQLSAPRSATPPVFYSAPAPEPRYPSPPLLVPQAPAIVPVEQVPPPSRVQRLERAPSSPIVVDTEPGTATPPVVTGGSGQQNLFQGRQPGTGGDNAGARASVIANRSDTVPIGTVIPIVLETPIDTARPGLVRAVTSNDTRGFDGRRVLVPRGSRLIGEYSADVRPGQNRVLVNWTRLVRPDGVTVQLASPAADALGGAGVPGRVHSFFLQRFAGALLQSALAVGVNLASRPRSGSVVVGLPSGPIAGVGQGLLPTGGYPPKITVKQGALLNVFVARDLDFSAPGAAGGR